MGCIIISNVRGAGYIRKSPAKIYSLTVLLPMPILTHGILVMEIPLLPTIQQSTTDTVYLATGKLYLHHFLTDVQALLIP